MNSPQRRVLYVLQGLPVPFDRRAWLHATTLARSGYAVSFICPKGRGYNTSREERDGVDIYRYWRPIEGEGKLAFIAESLWCFCATFLLSLRVQLSGRGFDILHVCNPPEIYWLMAWFWRLEDAAGAELTEPTSPQHSSQSDAESWLGEQWRELAGQGVVQVSLFDEGTLVYGPMSLSEA